MRMQYFYLFIISMFVCHPTVDNSVVNFVMG
jgi:hypothetical protein